MAQICQPLLDNFENVDRFTLENFLERLESAQDVVDEIWRADDLEPMYPEQRMRHLLDVIGNIIGECFGAEAVVGFVVR